MSDIASKTGSPPRRRADAERSIAAILDAAVGLLATKPDASMAELARAAGVTRQTVYAHFASRDALLGAVAERAMGQTLAAIDAAEPQDGSPAEALDRLVTAWWSAVEPHARVLEALAAASPVARDVRDFHAPILERLEQLVRRGQRAKEFDRASSPAWLVAAFLGLVHTAADEVAAGRLGADEAGAELARTIPRVFGVAR